MSVILCPHCGTTNRVGSNFCNACGTDLRSGDEGADRSADSAASSAASSVEESAGTPPAEENSGASRRRRSRKDSRRARPDEDSRRTPPGDADEIPPPTPFFPEQSWLRREETDTPPSDLQPTDLPATDMEGGADTTAPAATAAGESDQDSGEADTPQDERSGGFDPVTGVYFDDGWDDEWAEDAFGSDDLEALADDPTRDPTRAPRLVTGIQGLLDPIRVSRRLRESPQSTEAAAARRHAQQTREADDPVRLEKLRRFRNLLYEDPRLPGNRREATPLHGRSVLVVSWIFLLVAIMVGVPVFFGWDNAGNRPAEWPGVVEAHNVIDTLPPDAVVLLYWAYDPATAGELDLAARPVIRHLLEKRARLVGVSALPTGPATARRVVEQVRQTRDASGLFSDASRNPWPVQVAFLPGGTSALPLIAADPVAALGLDRDEASTQDLLVRSPALTVVLGAQADDVQQWLEQVQTRLRIPAVAVVGAGADPLVRPYLDSGQLRGLVSGFDGAYHYNRRVGVPPASDEARTLAQQVDVQNWAQGAILLLLALGNLAALVGRGDRG